MIIHIRIEHNFLIDRHNEWMNKVSKDFILQ